MIAFVYCAGLFAVGVLLLFVLKVGEPWMPPEKVHEELVTIGLQVIVFGLAGGAIKLLLDHRAERRRFRIDMLERMGQAHKDVYRIRRLLPLSERNDVRALLGELMDTRQDLGAAYHTLRMGSDFKEVLAATEAMRAYLEEVIKSALSVEGTPARAKYLSFIGWETSGTYEEEFRRAYKKAKHLLDPSAPPPPGEGDQGDARDQQPAAHEAQGAQRLGQ